MSAAKRRVASCTYYYGDRMKEDEMGGACCMHTEFCLENLKQRNRLEERCRWEDNIKINLK
jgi:hypothetical protein